MAAGANKGIDETLIERELELETLETSLEAVAAGVGRVIAIEASAGIGKTRLLDATRSMAFDRGFRVLAARGIERQREFSWGVVRHLYEPVIAAATDAELTQLWEGPAASARPLFETDPTRGEPAPDSSFAIQHGLLWLTANLAAEQPVLLAVDDLHWCDSPSLAFLDYLGRQIEAFPIAIAGAARPAEPGADQALLDSFSTAPGAERIDPRPLTERGSIAVLRRTLAAEARPGLFHECHQATGGNPLLLLELGRAVKAAGEELGDGGTDELLRLGSRAVARTVEVRLGRAGPAAEALAAAAAVLGSDAPLARAVALSGLDDRAADEATVALRRLEVLRPAASVQFVHPVVHSAVYERVPPRERARLHGESARLLEAGGAPVEQVASHLIEVDAGGDEAVVEKLRSAARSAFAGGDPRSAARFLERAMTEPPPEDQRTAVLTELGTALAFVDIDASVSHMKEALARTSDPAGRARIAEILALGLQFRERYAEGVEIAREVLDELPESAGAALRRRLHTAAIETGANSTAYGFWAASETDRVREPEPGDRDGLALWALASFMQARDLDIDYEEAIRRARRSVADPALHDAASTGVSHILPGMSLGIADQFDEALEVCARAMRHAEQAGSMFAYSTLRIWRALIHSWAGSLEDVIADGEEGLRTALALGNRPGPAWAAGALAEAMVETGDVDRAEAALERALPADGMAPKTLHWTNFRLGQARIALARGEHADAAAVALEAGEIYETTGGRCISPALYSWRNVAVPALLAGGESDRAKRLAAEQLELARRWRGPRTVGFSLRLLGQTEEPAAALELFRESVAVLESSQARLELARSLIALGAAERRANRKKASREPLRRGMELAAACGAEPLAERARTELRASGVRARRDALTGVEALTPSERRTAALAAAGRSNKEIAQELFVTMKTVEVHLSNAYRKLEIKGRAELDRAMTPA